MSDFDPKKPRLAVDLPSPPEMTPEQWKEFHEQLRAKREITQASKRWHDAHGWKDGRTCRCRVCSGRVVSDVRQKHDSRFPIMIGGCNSMHTVHNGYYCEDCGIRYKKLTGNITMMTREEIEKHG